MANDIHNGDPLIPDHKRFYSSFIGVLKASVVALAILLIAMALFLVR